MTDFFQLVVFISEKYAAPKDDSSHAPSSPYSSYGGSPEEYGSRFARSARGGRPPFPIIKGNGVVFNRCCL